MPKFRCFNKETKNIQVISVDSFKHDVPMMDLKDDECILHIKGNVHENHELLEDV